MQRSRVRAADSLLGTCSRVPNRVLGVDSGMCLRSLGLRSLHIYVQVEMKLLVVSLFVDFFVCMLACLLIGIHDLHNFLSC